jgi:hypothetical protein
MRTIPDPQTLDAYVEARLGLIEELFAQIFGMFPPAAAEAFATGYNQRRAGIILHFKPESDEAKQIMAAEAKAQEQSKPSLVLVPPSNIIIP